MKDTQIHKYLNALTKTLTFLQGWPEYTRYSRTRLSPRCQIKDTKMHKYLNATKNIDILTGLPGILSHFYQDITITTNFRQASKFLVISSVTLNDYVVFVVAQ